MRAILVAVSLTFAGLLVFELTMQPTGSERMGILLILSAMALGIVGAATLLPRLDRRTLSLRHTVIAVSVVSFVIVAIGMGTAGQQMFLSSHDLSLLFVFLGFGLAAALVFALLVSRPLTRDLERISSTASSIASGDLSARAGVDRSDEVGSLAKAVDDMALALEEARLKRERDERSRSELLTAIGHDLRTPLAAIRAALEAVQDGVGGSPERFYESMDRDLTALSQMVDDLFELTTIESGQRAFSADVIDLTEVADDVASSFAVVADKKHVRIGLASDERVMAVAGGAEMARVVRNLLDNAVRHCPDGGRVTVSVTNGPVARLSVIDEGDGFSEAFVGKAFERFSRDDETRARAGGGAGLGLAIAKGYVEAFGGEISARPGPPGEVVLTLPTP